MNNNTYIGQSGISATIIADSFSEENSTRITTLQLKFHRFILPEFNTHRQFSRNASSSRAIPAKTLNNQVLNDTAIPVHWGQNQSGMQAKDEEIGKVEVFTELDTIKVNAEDAWSHFAEVMAEASKSFSDAGLHKQVANRLTEPFQYSNVIVTATEWENFFNLRLHKDAQPEIRELAYLIKEAMHKSGPKVLKSDEWHLPYIFNEEWDKYTLEELIKLSVARCARVSYLNHDNTKPVFEKDIALADMLLQAGHMSPFEHQATPMKHLKLIDDNNILSYLLSTKGVTHINQNTELWSGNFKNWIQYRQLL